MRYLGIDYGTKRIGIAVSDASGSMAFPEKVIENDGCSAAAGEIIALARKKNAEAIVLGESRNYRGEANPVQAEIEAFKKLLEKELPVYYENETMTSAEAARSLPREGMLDASAAAIILNSYLARRLSEK